MTHRQVRFTTTAQEHVDREKAWLLENRDHVDVFAEELEQALVSDRPTLHLDDERDSAER